MLLASNVEQSRARVAEIGKRLKAGGAVHLVGMAGFGMAGLALLLRERGWRVTGCDLVRNRIWEWLTSRGFTLAEGHDASHLDGVSWVVRSTAVSDSCPEVSEAVTRGIPVEYRGFVLPALLPGRFSVAVSGTHGKTTVAAMTAQMLTRCGLSPSFCIGGEVEALGGVAGAGGDPYVVVEADESDGTLVLYEPDVAVITNIEFDHMEHFETPEMLERCFDIFARSARHTTVYCADDPRASAIGGAIRNAWSYGTDERADVHVQVARSGPWRADITIRAPDGRFFETALPVAGLHNGRNAAAAFAVGLQMGLDPQRMATALAQFVPVKRRLEIVTKQEDFCVVTDYGHHPTEIRAVMDVLALWPKKRLMVIFQPHRYTRTRALGKEFPSAMAGADEVILLPVYAASEAPLPGGCSEDLLEHFHKAKQPPVRLLASLDEAWNYLHSNIRAGDVWLVIGAGDVEQVAWRAQKEWSTVVPRFEKSYE